MVEFVSPLKAWPGKVELPDPDDFSGAHWATWKTAVNKPKRKTYALSHLYAYAGLEFIRAHGNWQMEMALEQAQAWEDDPEAERIKLVAWLGRNLMAYMDGIIDPKE
jgi:hypothetical protein